MAFLTSTYKVRIKGNFLKYNWQLSGHTLLSPLRNSIPLSTFYLETLLVLGLHVSHWPDLPPNFKTFLSTFIGSFSFTHSQNTGIPKVLFSVFFFLLYIFSLDDLISNLSLIIPKSLPLTQTSLLSLEPIHNYSKMTCHPCFAAQVPGPQIWWFSQHRNGF